jgi:hypothetical protein
MASSLTRPPEDWAELCRAHAAEARDPSTKRFLDQLAREFDLVVSEERDVSSKTPSGEIIAR